ncbi:MAG: hypothetical protein AB8W37_02350 [Arsenophonus endosymbiont of Dermacentor nuttalli]
MKGKLALRTSSYTDKSTAFIALSTHYASKEIITTTHCFILILQQKQLQLNTYLPIETAISRHLTMLAPLPWLSIPACYLIALLEEQLSTISIAQLGISNTS